MMTLNTTPFGDLPQQPFSRSATYLPDQLIAGYKNLVTDTVVITGGQAYQRGTVLGQITQGTLSAQAGPGNAGNGTLTALVRGPMTAIGIYILKATSPTSFSVTEPSGDALPPVTVGTPYIDAQIGFTLNAGATAFAVGDSFTIAVPPGSNAFQISNAAATDGSQIPAAILADDMDVSNGDLPGGIYVAGEFNGNALILGPGMTLSGVKSALRGRGIFVKNALSAADPT